MPPPYNAQATTLLKNAINENNTDKILNALDQNADPNVYIGLSPLPHLTNQPASALYIAMINQNINAIRALCTHGAEISPKEFTDVIFTNQLSNGRDMMNVVDVLLKLKPSLASESFEDDVTVLHMAAAFANPNMIKRFLNSGAAINAVTKQGTPLHMAVTCKQNIEVIRTLLDSGADISICNENGETSMDIAKREDVPEDVLQYLENAEQSRVASLQQNFSSYLQCPVSDTVEDALNVGNLYSPQMANLRAQKRDEELNAMKLASVSSVLADSEQNQLKGNIP